MPIAIQSLIVLGLTFALYLGVLAWSFFRARFFLGRFAMLGIALGPLVWETVATDSDAPGPAILAMLLVIPAIVFVAIGVGVALAKFARGRVRKWRAN